MKKLQIRGLPDEKIILSMRSRAFKRHTKGKFLLPVKDFCFSVFYGTKPTLYARGRWNSAYNDVDLIFRSTDLAVTTRHCLVKQLGWHKNVVYSSGKISMRVADVNRYNVYCVFNTERDMLKFKLNL